MKTITFYSYKGGVGRSLALSHIATRLAELHKKVCVIDFDLDAPGLRFKFQDYVIQKKIERGIVDYIYDYSSKGVIPKSLNDYIVQLIPQNVQSGPIHFFSAGDIESDEYWKKLSMIRWADLFYSENSNGIRFFLDLKAKIEKELKPDVLLIDSRTGITDVSGITLKLFADEIVVLAVDNKENIWGTKKILRSLLKQSHPLLKKNPKVLFALTRLPFTDTPQDKEKEFNLLQKKREEFKSELSLTDFEIFTIHSDRRLEEKERNVMGITYNDKATSISNDYLKLFNSLTEDLLTTEETKKFESLKLSASEFSASLAEKDIAKKLAKINRAIELNDSNYQYFQERGVVYWNLQKIDESIKDFLKVIELYPGHRYANYALSILFYNQRKFKSALKYLDYVEDEDEGLAATLKAGIFSSRNQYDLAMDVMNKAVNKFPSDPALLNSRADLLRKMKKYPEALQDIYKAIELDPSNRVYFGTLAEINADSGNIENFYLNLTISLSKGLTIEEMGSVYEVYLPFFDDKRFTELLEKYQIDLDALAKYKDKPAEVFE